MSTKLFLIAFTAFLGTSQFANAGVLMFVDFGTSSLVDRNGVQSTINPGATRLTANIYMQLTGNTSIYGYRFSVRYNDAILDLDLDPVFSTDVDKNDPDGFKGFAAAQDAARPAPFIRDSTIPTFGPAVERSHIPDLISNSDFKELRRFNGTMTSGNVGGAFGGPTFFRVASVDFVVEPTATLSPGTALVIAGKFEAEPPLPAPFTRDVLIDGVFTEDEDLGSVIDYPFQSFGGSVSITTVPEPASILVFGSVGLGALLLHRRKNPTKSIS